MRRAYENYKAPLHIAWTEEKEIQVNEKRAEKANKRKIENVIKGKEKQYNGLKVDEKEKKTFKMTEMFLEEKVN